VSQKSESQNEAKPTKYTKNEIIEAKAKDDDPTPVRTRDSCRTTVGVFDLEQAH
jgi:hypothetical protein